MFVTIASTVALSADGSRCVASVKNTTRLFTKKGDGAWAEKWQRETASYSGGPIRFLRCDTRFALVEYDSVRTRKSFARHSLLVWDVRTGREVGRTEPSRKRFSHLVPVGKQLVVGMNATNGKNLPQGEILAYDADHLDREPQQVLTSESQIAAVCADPFGRFVLTATAKLVTQWDPNNWLPIRTFNWKIGTITCLTINSTGTLAAAGGHQGKVAVWDVE